MLTPTIQQCEHLMTLDNQDLHKYCLAYFITFRCYGTWFHGDERGSVDRRFFNEIHKPRLPTIKGLVDFEGQSLRGRPMFFGVKRRDAVILAIREACRNRRSEIHALNVRTNHVHVVVSSSSSPEKLMGTIKAYATMALRKKHLVRPNQPVWARHGSTRYLWTPSALERVVRYVLFEQGGNLDTLLNEIDLLNSR